MKKFLSRLTGKVKKGKFDEYDDSGEPVDEYVELDTNAHGDSSKIIVRPFSLGDFSDIKAVLDAMREGNTICLINIRPLKEKDLVELKRAINKLKKTCDATDSDIAGFSEDYIVITPPFAEIYRTKQTAEITEQ